MRRLTEPTLEDSRDFALGVCRRLHDELGVDLAPILLNVHVSERERLRRARADLAQATLERAARLGMIEADFSSAELERLLPQLSAPHPGDLPNTATLNGCLSYLVTLGEVCVLLAVWRDP